MQTRFVTRFVARISLSLFCLLRLCHASEVALIEQRGESGNWEEQVSTACRFYGLDLKVLTVAESGDEKEVIETIKKTSTVAVLASAMALSHLHRSAILAALTRPNRNAVPLMILGITAVTDINLLKLWSRQAIVGREGPDAISNPGIYRVVGSADVTRDLAGQTFSISGGFAYGLDLDPARSPETLIYIRGAGRDLPVFGRIRDGKQELFFQSEYSPAIADRNNLLTLFSEIAPVLMFVRYGAGEYGWHSAGHYANLTIDDPWLIEPYGNLNYEGLLKEMQKFNFHTTISFIPWNFDRSRPDVVALFRDHPDRYSIAVHGDNHDHVEFGDYRKVPLNHQTAALRQAVARMEAFRKLTGLPYDRVMVWPHEVLPPAPTLEALKEYNFLGNVNGDTVPLGSDRPADLPFLLRSTTLRFSNFPTVRRLPIVSGAMEPRIAVEAFLGNPILLWQHQDFFLNGINAFDDMAAAVNRIQPDSHWTSLGNIMRHLYLVKLREDGDYNVKAFSSQITLENCKGHVVKFFVQKDESFSPPIQSLTEDGKQSPYRRLGDSLLLEVAVPARESREIVITYANDLDISRVDLSKSSWRINLLRRVSDFRDLKLSRNPAGAAASRFYYSYLFSERMPIEWVLGVVLLVLLALGALTVGWRIAQRAARPGKM